MSFCKVTLLGIIGNDLELKYVSVDKVVCKFSVATHKKFKTSSGQMEDKTEWHKVEVWGQLAENLVKYQAKGGTIFVEGDLENQSWEKNGEKKYATIIKATNIHYVSKGTTTAQARPQDNVSAQKPVQEANLSVPPVLDDIPF